MPLAARQNRSWLKLVLLANPQSVTPVKNTPMPTALRLPPRSDATPHGERNHNRQRDGGVLDPEDITQERPGSERHEHCERVADDDMRKEITALAHEEVTAARASFRTIQVAAEQLAFAAYRAAQSQERAELHGPIVEHTEKE